MNGIRDSHVPAFGGGGSPPSGMPQGCASSRFFAAPDFVPPMHADVTFRAALSQLEAAHPREVHLLRLQLRDSQCLLNSFRAGKEEKVCSTVDPAEESELVSTEAEIGVFDVDSGAPMVTDIVSKADIAKHMTERRSQPWHHQQGQLQPQMEYGSSNNSLKRERTSFVKMLQSAKVLQVTIPKQSDPFERMRYPSEWADKGAPSDWRRCRRGLLDQPAAVHMVAQAARVEGEWLQG
mmetsp:Transcript_1028/g.4217  ORF Transcript_1028/g.4217 Transcript_1028/m.4217 type:complete len:236 (-) Transcript_1028:1403-2110(-)